MRLGFTILLSLGYSLPPCILTSYCLLAYQIMISAMICIFLSLLLNGKVSWSQSLDPVQDMCARWHHQCS